MMDGCVEAWAPTNPTMLTDNPDTGASPQAERRRLFM
jgi:hypothetical protein